jgi:hypothetical protein
MVTMRRGRRCGTPLTVGIAGGTVWWAIDPQYPVAWMGYVGKVMWAAGAAALACRCVQEYQRGAQEGSAGDGRQ